MSHESARPTPADAGSRPDTPGHEVRKFEVDDLLQEGGNLERRMQRLEGRLPLTSWSVPEGVDPAQGMVSTPDPRCERAGREVDGPGHGPGVRRQSPHPCPDQG